jgi:hypothetical protein
MSRKSGHRFFRKGHAQTKESCGGDGATAEATSVAA